MIENDSASTPNGDGLGTVPIDPERATPEVASLLEKIGASDRRAMPADLVDRAMLRTQSMIVASAGRAHLARDSVRDPARDIEGQVAPASVRRWSLRGDGWRAGALRSAAALALMGAVAGVWRSMPRERATIEREAPASVARVALDVDLLDGGPWSSALDHEISVLLAESAMLVGEIDGDAGDLLDEGAM